MRRFLALARTAALESLAEPLSAVMFLSALLTVHLAPVFHYHRFGEAGRLARECGLSALLMFGLVFATSAAVRTIGRELASGTASAALARAVPRTLFQCAKTAGVGAAFTLFTVAAACATVLSVRCSVLGAALAAEGGGQVWGPGVACGAGGTLVAFALAAAANRFLRWRFCVSACLFTACVQPVALAVAVGMGGFAAGALGYQAVRLGPAFAVLAAGCLVFVAFASAMAVRLQPASVTALLAAAVLASFCVEVVGASFAWAGAGIRAFFPVLSDFWLADRLAGGGLVAWRDVARPLAAAALQIVFWLGIGSVLLARRELS